MIWQNSGNLTVLRTAFSGWKMLSEAGSKARARNLAVAASKFRHSGDSSRGTGARKSAVENRKSIAGSAEKQPQARGQSSTATSATEPKAAQMSDVVESVDLMEDNSPEQGVVREASSAASSALQEKVESLEEERNRLR